MNPTIELRGVRGIIAKNMALSLSSTAQYTLFCDAAAARLWREKQRLQKTGATIGFEDLLLAVICRTLKKHPILNGRINQTRLELSDNIDLNLAVDTPAGLMAPLLRNADTLSEQQLYRARKTLIAKAKQGVLTPQEMALGTFTISNMGSTRVTRFTPIINYPQVAILGIGATFEKAVRGTDGNVAFQPHITFSLTVDHRFIDGKPAGDFLTDLCQNLEGVAD